MRTDILQNEWAPASSRGMKMLEAEGPACEQERVGRSRTVWSAGWLVIMERAGQEMLS